MKKALSLLLCLMLGVSLITGCGSQKTAEPKEGKKIVIRFASNSGDNVFKSAPYGMAILKFIDEVQKRSNGRVEVKLFKGGQLGTSAEQVIGGLQTGAFEMTNWTLGSFGEYTKAFMPFNLPYLFANTKEVHKFVDGSIGKRMEDQLAKDSGLKLLAYLDMGFRHVTNSKRPIKTPNDMAGLKIRTMIDPYQIEAMKALGASPTPIAFTELFTALQQGVVDAQENPIMNIYDARFYEVQKYMSTTSHIYGFTSLIINEKFFNSLPQDIQKIIMESADIAEKYSREQNEKVEEQKQQEMSKHMEITKLSPEELKPFQEKAKATWPKIKEAIGVEYYDQIINEVAKIQKETGSK